MYTIVHYKPLFDYRFYYAIQQTDSRASVIYFQVEQVDGGPDVYRWLICEKKLGGGALNLSADAYAMLIDMFDDAFGFDSLDEFVDLLKTAVARLEMMEV